MLRCRTFRTAIFGPSVAIAMVATGSAQQPKPHMKAVVDYNACLRDSSRMFDDEKSDILSVARGVMSICGKEQQAMLEAMAKSGDGRENPMQLARTLRDVMVDDACKAVLLSRFSKKPAR